MIEKIDCASDLRLFLRGCLFTFPNLEKFLPNLLPLNPGALFRRQTSPWQMQQLERKRLGIAWSWASQISQHLGPSAGLNDSSHVKQKWVCLKIGYTGTAPNSNRHRALGKSMVTHWILGGLYFQTNLNNWRQNGRYTMWCLKKLGVIWSQMSYSFFWNDHS